jgi:indole-3-glycerol phosphate synthase
MDILTEIIAHKRREVESRKTLYPIALLEQSRYYAGKPVSLRAYLRRPDKSGIIAEIKRMSPSKGMINKHLSVERTSIGYMQAGASALSVLTDSTYFGGSSRDLETARAFNFCPILRKDFIVDAYQVVEAKSIGADAILLIAACLSAKEIDALGGLAHSLGMEVLCEVHSADELPKALSKSVDLVGVNNRDLKTFKTDVATSLELSSKIPADFLKVSESGIESPDTVRQLKKEGFEGFLIGEHFMRHARPEEAARDFIKLLA